jgi:hypothetical protein
MAVNVTNIDGIARAFVIANFHKQYPDLDITENSAFDDLFIKPTVAELIPIIEEFNSMEMKSNLKKNAEYMTEDELDAVIEGNYFIKRNLGTKATTLLTLSFANVLEGETIIIPAGITFQTSDSLQFQTVNRTSYTYSEMLPLYNLSTSNYDLPVAVEAVDVGTDYNVSAGSIISCLVLFNSNMVSVTNLLNVSDGTDKESNIDYADRAESFYISRQLGTKPGYESFIKDNFKEVEDVCVIGYKDPQMERDTIKVYNPETSQYVDKHIGGAVDIYIKGYIYDTETAKVILHTNLFLLSQNYDSIAADSVSALNNTDGTKTPVILSKASYTLNGQNKMAVVLDNTGEQSFSASADSQIYITYNYLDDEGATKSQVDSFIVGDAIAVIETPVKEVLSLKDGSGALISDISTHYELIKSGITDTTQEVCSIKLIDFDSIPNGSEITVDYTINYTLKSMGEVLNKG